MPEVVRVRLSRWLFLALPKHLRYLCRHIFFTPVVTGIRLPGAERHASAKEPGWLLEISGVQRHGSPGVPGERIGMVHHWRCVIWAGPGLYTGI